MRKLFVVCLLFIVNVMLARPWVLLFGSRDCEECNEFKTYWQAEYTGTEDPVLVFLDIDDDNNYDYLELVEKELKPAEEFNTFPIMVVGGRFVAGREGYKRIKADLREMLKETPSSPLFSDVNKAALMATKAVVSFHYQPGENQANEQKEKNVASSDATVSRVPRLLFFKLQSCRKCSRQSKELELLRKALPQMEIAEYDVASIEGLAMLNRARRYLELPRDEAKNLAPMVVWAEDFATGRLVEAKKLEVALKAPLTGKEFWLEPLTEEELKAEKSRLSAFIETMTVGMVVLGGLLDGINPCAFATSIFLISYLLYLKKKRRDIIIVGAGFCVGVFLTYFLYGLVLSVVLKKLQSWTWLKMALYGGFSLCGFVLCILHLRDAFRYRKTGKASDMDMGLSKETHRGIHDKIKKFTTVHSWLLGPAAVVLGAVVSSMELACTGQVYFPVLTALMKDGATPRALWLLFAYNVLFIMPLAVITVLAAYGVGAKALGDWAKRHVFATKILMAVLFAVLGVVMLILLL